jgi:hypothetical protein
MAMPAAAMEAAAAAVLAPKVLACWASVSVEAAFVPASGVSMPWTRPGDGKLRSARSNPDMDNLLTASCIWAEFANVARTSRNVIMLAAESLISTTFYAD